jgi:hypothetical protein
MPFEPLTPILLHETRLDCVPEEHPRGIGELLEDKREVGERRLDREVPPPGREIRSFLESIFNRY